MSLKVTLKPIPTQGTFRLCLVDAGVGPTVSPGVMPEWPHRTRYSPVHDGLVLDWVEHMLTNYPGYTLFAFECALASRGITFEVSR